MTTFASALEQLEESSAYKNFMKKNPEAELCAGFFTVGGGEAQQSLDYILPDGKIFTFIISNEITLKEAETLESQGGKGKNLPPLDKSIGADLDDVQIILEEEFQKNNINKKINKIIAILHKNEGTQIWNLNCMLEGMEILQAHIDSSNGAVLNFEKRNMFDFIKKH